MDEDIIEIEPYPIDTAIHYVKVYLEGIKLNAVDCYCSVYEYDVNRRLLNMTRVYVPPEIYAEWGTSDDYIIDYCLDQLGFHKKIVNINL